MSAVSKICVLIILGLILCLPSRAAAFISFGNVGFNIDYEDFVPAGDGYDITFVNKGANHKAEFYIIVLGFDFRGATIFRNRIYIPFLPGYGRLSFHMPGYNEDVTEVAFQIRQPWEYEAPYGYAVPYAVPVPVLPPKSVPQANPPRRTR